jgi:hypothetical protein
MTKRELKELINRNDLTIPVARQLGYTKTRTSKDEREEFAQNLADVCRGGAASGWHGFCYYSDTCKFAAKHERAILRSVFEFEREMGEPFKNEGTYRDEDENTALNWLAWYALESVAHEYESIKDEAETW